MGAKTNRKVCLVDVVLHLEIPNVSCSHIILQPYSLYVCDYSRTKRCSTSASPRPLYLVNWFWNLQTSIGINLIRCSITIKTISSLTYHLK